MAFESEPVTDIAQTEDWDVVIVGFVDVSLPLVASPNPRDVGVDAARPTLHHDPGEGGERRLGLDARPMRLQTGLRRWWWRR